MATHFVTYRPFRDELKPDFLDRYDDFLSWKEEGAVEGWSARKTFQSGDVAIFYLTAPLMAIVGLGLVDNEPYYDETILRVGFKNAVYCDFRPVWFLESRVSIKEVVQHQGLQAWWDTCPYRSIRRIEPSVAQALVQEILNGNQGLERELQHLGWSASHPLDFSMVSQKPSQPPVSERKQWQIEDLLALHWRQFEMLIGEVFKRKFKRARVELTSPTVDGGADIIIAIGWPVRREIVECKRRRSGSNISSKAIREFVGTMTKFKARKGYFVTTSTFSSPAVNFVEGLNVELIDSQDLIEMIAGIESFPSPAEFARQHAR